MLIGHSKRATKLLADMFSKRLIRKTYEAIVKGNFEKVGQLEMTSDIDGRNAISHARFTASNKERDRSLVEVTIETGRKHQIRRHLSEAGFPIIGDRLYGGGDSLDLQLVAVSLAFTCPIKDVEQNYPLPDRYRPKL